MTETRIHADYCANRRAASEAYQTDWPKHCRTCGGWGSVPNQHPDFCSDCVEVGQCPRCDAQLPEGTAGPCRFCGWSDLHEGDQAHGGPECCCFDQPDPDADHEDDGEPE